VRGLPGEGTVGMRDRRASRRRTESATRQPAVSLLGVVLGGGVVAASLLAACSGHAVRSVSASASDPPALSLSVPRLSLSVPRPQDPGTSYLAVATPANRRLESAFDALDGTDQNDLAAARMDFQRAAATERGFDQSLRALALPSASASTVRLLVAVNEQRATLTAQAADASTLREVRAYESKLAGANDLVEAQVRALRSQLGLPPPPTG
jgi:hypothetical protein